MTEYYKQPHEWKTEDNLKNDLGWQHDALNLLKQKRNVEGLNDPTDIFNAWQEHFRYQNSNELTAMGDAWDVMTGTDSNALLHGRMQHTFEDGNFGMLKGKRDEDGSLNYWETFKNVGEGLGDYVVGGGTSPANIATAFTLGGSKIAGVTAQMTAKDIMKLGIREAGKRAAIGGTIEGSAGAARSGSQEYVRTEGSESETYGDNKEFDKSRVALEATIDGTIGGILTGAGTIPGTIRSIKYNKIKAEGDAAAKVLEENAQKISKVILNDKSKTNAVKKKNALSIKKMLLNWKKELPKDKVAEGIDIIDEESAFASTNLALPVELIDKIAAATARLASESGIKNLAKNTESGRITEVISEAIRTGKIDKEVYLKVLKEHNLSEYEFTKLYIADISIAAKKLNLQSQVVQAGSLFLENADSVGSTVTSEVGKVAQKLNISGKVFNKATNNIAVKNVEKLKPKNVRTIESWFEKIPENVRGMFSEDEAALLDGAYKAAGYGSTKFFEGIYNLNKSALLAMTIQPATTLRNVENGAMRVHVHALTNMFRARNPFRLYNGIFFDQQEGHLLKTLYNENFPDSKSRMFMDAADIQAESGLLSPAVTFTRKLNYFNTLFDNHFKSSIFTDELKHLLPKSNIVHPAGHPKAGQPKTLLEIVQAGEFKLIPPEIIAEAEAEALKFVYQGSYARTSYKTIGSAFANQFIKLFQTSGGSLAIPYPRYSMQAAEFAFKHAPIIGLVDLPLNQINKAFGVRPWTMDVTLGSVPKRVAQNAAGTTMLFTALGARMNMGDEFTEPLAVQFANGDVGKVDALLGPFTAHWIVADMLYRTNALDLAETMDELEFIKDRPDELKLHPDSFDIYWKPLFKAISGGQLRAGTFPWVRDETIEMFANLDPDAQYSDDQVNKYMARLVTDMVQRFTVPMGVYKDTVAYFDPKYRTIPDNTDVNMLKMMVKNLHRSFPRDANGGATWNKYMHLGLNKEVLPLHEYFEDNYDKLYDILSSTKDRPLINVLAGDTQKMVDPVKKQLTGISVQPPMSKTQKWVNRLAISYRNYFVKTHDEDLTYLTKMYMADFIAAEEDDLFNSKTFFTASESEKRTKVLAFLSKQKEKAKLSAKQHFTDMYEKGYYSYDVGKRQDWKNLSKQDRIIINAYWQSLGQKLSSEELNDIGWKWNTDIEESKAYDWALTTGKNYRDKIKGEGIK